MNNISKNVRLINLTLKNTHNSNGMDFDVNLSVTLASMYYEKNINTNLTPSHTLYKQGFGLNFYIFSVQNQLKVAFPRKSFQNGCFPDFPSTFPPRLEEKWMKNKPRMPTFS